NALMTKEHNQLKQYRSTRDKIKDRVKSNNLNTLWNIAKNNEWYRWASFTAKEVGMENCVLCSKSPLNRVVVVPTTLNYRNCAIFNRNFCHLDKKLRPYCPAECLTLLSSSLYNRHIERSRLGNLCRDGNIDQYLSGSYLIKILSKLTIFTISKKGLLILQMMHSQG
ncbi:MAG: hypothetical protein ACRC0X_03690, partial [Brevinema sp.]